MSAHAESASRRSEELARGLGASALQLYTIPETSEILRVSRWQIYQLLNRRELGSVKIGRRRLIPAREVERFVQSLSSGAAA